MTIEETRDVCYRREGGKCASCQAILDYSTFHLAHIIPQRKHWVKAYGKQVIHHPANMRATCPNDSCNGAQSLGNSHYAVDRHAKMVQDEIRRQRDGR